MNPDLNKIKEKWTKEKPINIKSKQLLSKVWSLLTVCFLQTTQDDNQPCAENMQKKK